MSPTTTMPPKKAPRALKTQDDLAKKEREKRERQEIGNFNHYLKIAKQSKAYWLSPSCQELRNFCQHYESNPDQFPMALSDSPRTDGQTPCEEVAQSQKTPSLSKGFVDQLCSPMGAFLDTEPVLQVLKFELKFDAPPPKKKKTKQQATLAKRNNTIPVRRGRLILWDGGQHMCLGILASNLNDDARHQLTDGQPIIRIKEFSAMHFQENEGSDKQLAVFILQYQFLCRPLLSPISMSNLIFTSPLEDPVEGPQPEVVHPSTNNDPVSSLHHSILAYEENPGYEPLPVECLVFCKPGARLCSRHGILVNHCIAEHYEDKIKRLDFLEAIAQGYPLVDQEVEDMTPNLQRNLLYWWFATNIFFVRGGGNRQQLPPCLTACIRIHWPNKKDVDYVGFKSRSVKSYL